MENGLAKQDILPYLHSIPETGNEKEITHGGFFQFQTSFLSKALDFGLCWYVSPKA